MDLASTLQLDRLWEAKKHSDQALEVFRKKRRGLVREFVGSNYSDDDAGQDVPVNFIQLAFGIYIRSLVSGEPRAKVTTPYMKLKRTGDWLRLALDQRAKEMKMRKRLGEIVRDALFSVGIAKIGLGAGRAGGQTFLGRVSLDDWTHDMTATSWETIQFAGHRYRLPLEAVRRSPRYNTPDKLQPSDRLTVNEGGEEKVSAISRGSTQSEDDEFIPLVDLWDLWVPALRAVVTVAEQQPHEPLRVVPWKGPTAGPYRLLCFDPVPDQIMPLSPGSQLLDLHNAGNILFRKLIDQAQRAKSLLTVLPGEKAQRDADNIMTAKDGDVIGVTDQNNVAERRVGGVDGNTMGIFLAIKQLLEYFGGNLATMGGLGPGAPTATQEQMMMSRSSEKIANMQDAVIEFCGDIFGDIAFYECRDPLLRQQVERTRRDGSVEQHTLQAGEIVGQWINFNFDIEPYSLQRRSPAERVGAVMQFVTGFALPAIQLFAAQGLQIDMRALTRMVAIDLNIPELAEAIKAGGMPIDLLPGSGGQVRQSPNTTRTTVRRSESEATPRGAEDVLMRGMMGQASQPSQVAGATQRMLG